RRRGRPGGAHPPADTRVVGVCAGVRRGARGRTLAGRVESGRQLRRVVLAGVPRRAEPVVLGADLRRAGAVAAQTSVASEQPGQSESTETSTPSPSKQRKPAAGSASGYG